MKLKEQMPSYKINMKKYQNIILTVNKGKTPDNNHPDYEASVVEGEGKFTKIGAGWKKTGKNNFNYVSIALNQSFDKNKNPVMYKTKEGKEVQRQGFVIIDEKDYLELLKYRLQATGETSDDILPF